MSSFREVLCFRCGGVLSVAAVSLALALPAAAGPPSVSVRQGGGGEEVGLLNGIEGPAALINLEPAAGARFRSIAGVRANPSSGAQQGYVAGTGRLQLSEGTAVRFNYIGDEYSGENAGGGAGEARLSSRFAAVTLALSETVSRGFEGPWTGYGEYRATSATNASATWAAFPNASFGGGARHAYLADGTETVEVSLNQSLSVGGGTIRNTTVTGIGHAAGSASGTLFYERTVFGKYGLNAGLDYHSDQGLRPSAASIGAQGRIDETWSLYSSASQPLGPDAVAHLDAGLNGEILGLQTDTYAGLATDGSGYVGVRMRVPLSADPRRDRRLGY